jgi:phage baseplate assembly protein W
MAYVRSTRVDPRDLQRNTAIGVKLPFNAPGVFYSTFSTKDQLKYNLVNLLLTSKGERIDNPEFGTLLRSQLFGQMTETTFSDIRDSVIDSVQTYIPEILINRIDFLQDGEYSSNTLVVKIDYQILISGQTDTVTVNFE